MSTNNKLKGTSIGGKYVGNDDFSTTLVLPEKIVETSYLYNREVIEKFSLNAGKYIAEIASDIVEINKDIAIPDDFGLFDQSLPKKFSNMKCSESYKHDFDEASKYFPQIHKILNSDSALNGNYTLVALFSIIKKLYGFVYPKYEDGSSIHAVIIGLLTEKNIDPLYYVSLEVLVFYTVYSCGIYNEKK